MQSKGEGGGGSLEKKKKKTFKYSTSLFLRGIRIMSEWN